MRSIIAYIPTMIAIAILALLGFHWKRQEREEERRQRGDR